MKQSINASLVWQALALLLTAVTNQAVAQSDAHPSVLVTTNQGPDRIDPTGDSIVSKGTDLGPNEVSMANVIELLCPQLIRRVPGASSNSGGSGSSSGGGASTSGVGTSVPSTSGGSGTNAQNQQNPPVDIDFGPLLILTHLRSLRAAAPVDPRSPEEIDLQRRCTELVLYRGNVRGREGQFTDLNTILRELNADEAAAQGRGLVEFSSIRAIAVAGRLQKLRLADAGRAGETVAFDTDRGRFNYNYETGGGAGDDGFSRWSFYANAELSTGDRDATVLEAGYDLDGGRATVGIDYRVGNNGFIGASLDYIGTRADFTNDSRLDTDGYDLTLYGTAYSDSGAYIEGTVGAGANDYKQDRRFRYTVPGVPGPFGTGLPVTTVNQTAKGNTSGDQWFASIGVGKDISSSSGWGGNLSLTLAYLDASIDGFAETISSTAPGFGMGLTIGDQDITSLRSTVGTQVSKAISTGHGVWVPFVRADWIHEFDNDSRTIIGSFANDSISSSVFQLTTDEPDQDYFRVGGGLSAVFAHGLQAFLSVDAVLGVENTNYYTAAIGIRKEL